MEHSHILNEKEPESIFLIDGKNEEYIPELLYKKYMNDKFDIINSKDLEKQIKDISFIENESYWESWKIICIFAEIDIDGDRYHIITNECNDLVLIKK